MPRQNLGPVGIKGLNSDTPAQKLDLSNFTRGFNMRPFDNSLQGVYDFTNSGSAQNVGGGLSNNRDIYAMVQWTPTGSQRFNLGYIYDDEAGEGPNFQLVTDLTNPADSQMGFVADTEVDLTGRFGVDLLTFNDLLIVNDGINQPIVIQNFGSVAAPDFRASFVLGWPGDTTPTDTTQQPEATRVTAERIIQYRNRLVALNISGSYLGLNPAEAADGTRLLETEGSQKGNATIIWSTPITELTSLNGVTFAPLGTNSAGDDTITETVGEVLDGAQLGEFLIIYKTDAVLQYTDTGAPLYLVGRVLFDDDGLYSPGCFADIGGGRHLVVGNQGIYIHDGGPNKQNISRGRIEKSLFEDIDPLEKDRTFIFHHSSDKEVWICLKSRESGILNSGCNLAYVYNYEADVWYRRSLPTDNMEGTRGITEGELNGELYIFAWGAFGVRQLGDERDPTATQTASGWVQFLDQDFGDPGVTKHINSVYPMGENTFQIAIQGKRNLTALTDIRNTLIPPPLSRTHTDVRTHDPSMQYKQDYRLNHRYYDIELSMEGTTNPLITGFDVELKQGGLR